MGKDTDSVRTLDATTRSLVGTAKERQRGAAKRVTAWLRSDWTGPKYVVWGAALALVTLLVVAAYYANKPYPERDPDTPAYLYIAHRYALHGWFVDPARLPGYPLFMRLIFAIAGVNNLTAIGLAQGILFVCATLEVYALLCLLLRRAPIAFFVALFLGANPIVLSYMKSLLSEGLALFLTVNLAVAVALWLRRGTALRLWLVAGWTLALFMTRPEWIYVPVPLFALLLLVAGRRGTLRRFLPHAIGAAVVLGAVLGLYVYANSQQNRCTCVTYIQNINLLGKVMQYHMQDEAPPEYADVTRLVDRFERAGDFDPWDVIRTPYAPIQRDYYSRVGAYGVAIIQAHPLEYLGHSAPLAIESLGASTPFRPLAASGPFAGPLAALTLLAQGLMWTFAVFPALALFWWGLLLFGPPATRRSLTVELMAAMSLLAFYDLALTTLGGYIYYPRLHTPFVPLLIVVVWGSIALGARRLAAVVRERRTGRAALARRAPGGASGI